MEKVENWFFFVSIVLFDTIMYQKLTPMEFWRSGSFGDLGQRSHVSCQRASPLKLLGQFYLNFICSLLAKKERKSLFFCTGHMTKMAAMPIYGKNLEKTSSPEPLSGLP